MSLSSVCFLVPCVFWYLSEKNKFKQMTNLLPHALHIVFSQKVLPKGFQETLSFSEIYCNVTRKIYPTHSKSSTRWRQSSKALKAIGEMWERLAKIMFLSWCKVCLKMRAGLWPCLLNSESYEVCGKRWIWEEWLYCFASALYHWMKKVHSFRLMSICCCLLYCKGTVWPLQLQKN